ncbi:hypothetical protein [Mycoplasmopsis columbina]|uniref:Uncharacterized protein n=1 Tax=Mycoplasmopsis columbina SF7 TaxID=1037410 RepID=F9UK63_9BACT|nr:hypothetical protein [Mycoplasmopsis columbina]EGV00068.1 hypothetical protein MCSF7_01371 [Mycoplasmopsis columbina SF7]VEU76964.1 Uncharacterised protein [Mycoplasmopsis columbina]
MENYQLNQNYGTALPVLKPILLNQDFLTKVKGEKLKSNILVLIAEDENYVFFVSCLKELSDSSIDEQDFVLIKQNEGLNENGELTTIDLAKFVDLRTIFKIDYFDLKSKVVNDNNQIKTLPYLGIQNQLEVVNKISDKLNSKTNLPKLVMIKKVKNKN